MAGQDCLVFVRIATAVAGAAAAAATTAAGAARYRGRRYATHGRGLHLTFGCKLSISLGRVDCVNARR
uniref:Putative secreted peptide n=1 Tax=Anopheles braziliensis TaxID=58242 RepID=A0A2M3ZR79_9DIPT